MNKKISVIIPAYNSEKYIEATLQSIRKQTYKNMEIIVVDDGSTDSTGKIIDQIAQEDQRVIPIHIKNAGVTNARNVGIGRATGEYIGFCDADDLMEADMYEHLMELVEKYQVKMAHCGYNHITGENILPVKGTGKLVLQARDEGLFSLLGGGLFIGSLCNKLYAAELFEGIDIDPTIKINEDILMNFYIMRKLEKSVFHDVAKYNYITREDTGACLNTDFVKKAENSLKVIQLINEEVQEEAIGLKQLCYEKLIMAYIDLYRCILFSEKLEKTEKKRRTRKILDILWHNLRKKGVQNRKNRTTIYLLKFLPALYPTMFRIYDKIRVKNIDV